MLSQLKKLTSSFCASCGRSAYAVTQNMY
uniref:Uncharacterized protein n=1 Tax=Anguilla anguilla TaxID=7936 RepID=A0A0E9TX41_ANGAN